MENQSVKSSSACTIRPEVESDEEDAGQKDVSNSTLIDKLRDSWLKEAEDLVKKEGDWLNEAKSIGLLEKETLAQLDELSVKLEDSLKQASQLEESARKPLNELQRGTHRIVDLLQQFEKIRKLVADGRGLSVRVAETSEELEKSLDHFNSSCDRFSQQLNDFGKETKAQLKKLLNKINKLNEAVDDNFLQRLVDGSLLDDLKRSS